VQRWLRAITVALGTARGARGQAVDATTAIDRALSRLEGEADAQVRREAWIEAGRAFGAISLFDRAREAFDRAEQLSTEGRDERRLESVLMARAEVARRSGEMGEAGSLLERLEPMVAARGDSKQLYDVFVGLAQSVAANTAASGIDRSIAYLEKAEKVAQAIGDGPVFQVERAKVRALVHMFAGDHIGFAEWSEKAADLARNAGLLYETAINLHNLGDARLRLGDNAASYAALQQSLALAEEIGHERLALINRAPIVYLDGLAGHADAVHKLAEIVAWTRQRNLPWDELNARYLLGLLHLHRGARDKAIEELEKGKSLALQLSMRSLVSDCDEALARARR
jgi:tetratricopeptide (TPR) repeat protein